MVNSRSHYRSMVIYFCLITLFSFAILLFLFSKAQTAYIMINQTVNIGINVSKACKHYHEFRLDAPRSEFDIQIHEKLQNCLQPEKDSRQLSDNLDFMWRPK